MLLAKNYDFRSRTTCSILYKGCMKILTQYPSLDTLSAADLHCTKVYFGHPFHWRTIQTCLPLSSPEFGGGIAVLDIYCGNRSRLLCARQAPPHEIRVRLVSSRLRPYHLRFIILGRFSLFTMWLIKKLARQLLFIFHPPGPTAAEETASTVAD